MQRTNLALFTVALAVLAGCATHQKESADNGMQKMPIYQPTIIRLPSAADDTPDFIYEGGPAAKLEDCGGTSNGEALLVRVEGQLKLRVRNTSCASWASSRTGYQAEKLNRLGNDTFGGDIAIEESVTGFRQVILGSSNYIKRFKDKNIGNAKGNLVNFYVPPQKVVMDIRYWNDADGRSRQEPLKSCGGSVQSQINADRSLSVIFRGVENCTHFVFKTNNWAEVGKRYQLEKQKKWLWWFVHNFSARHRLGTERTQYVSL